MRHPSCNYFSKLCYFPGRPCCSIWQWIVHWVCCEYRCSGDLSDLISTDRFQMLLQTRTLRARNLILRCPLSTQLILRYTQLLLLMLRYPGLIMLLLILGNIQTLETISYPNQISKLRVLLPGIMLTQRSTRLMIPDTMKPVILLPRSLISRYQT